MSKDNLNNTSLDNSSELNTSSETSVVETTVGTAVNKNVQSEMSEGKKTKKKKLNMLPKFICAVIAIFIWVYVMQVESPDYESTFENVPVTLTNVSVLENERQLSVYEGYEYEVDVTVNGKKSIISKYKPEDVTVTVDLKDITEAGEYELSFKVKLPSGLSLVETEYKTIPVYVDVRGSVNVPVRAQLSGAVYNEELYEYGELKTEFTSVMVTGPQTALADVSHAMATADFSALNTITSTTSSDPALVLIGTDGQQINNPHIKPSRETVKVTLPVYIEKVVPLEWNSVHGIYNENNSAITLSPDNVRIKGDPSVLANINSINVVTFDEKQYTENFSVNYVLEDTDKYTIVSENVINVTVTHLDTVIDTYVVRNITVNAGNHSYRVKTDWLRVNLRHPDVNPFKLTASDIEILADISDYPEDYSGTVTVDGTIVITKKGFEDVYEIGTYQVEIDIIPKE